MKTLAAACAVLVVIVVGAAAIGGLALAAAAATLLAVGMPLVVDAGLAVTAPLEHRLGAKFVDRAAARLASVRPTVVAITGSYGKTSTKGYVAHLVSGTRTVVASPASFNNRNGLARAVNEHLVPGTEVFVAEMGTYGRGEIADMCRWVTPDIAVITAIGPVHLERMGSEERIAEAKSEILDPARVVVLNVDSRWLAPLAERETAAGKKVFRCSAADRDADVCVLADGDRLEVWAQGAAIGTLPAGDAQPVNVACAVAVALELGVPKEAIARRLAGLPVAPHRREVSRGRSGAMIIDDTYNANPAGAASALDLLAKVATNGHRRVVVTPGMVELGERQNEENTRFAAAAARVATDLVVVGQTNAQALLSGAANGGATVVRLATREQAVAWVADVVGEGDAVLYENDLPDHFP